ncbi:electron transport complex, RnfABCDGE type, A subunit [Magnetococcus marinus MC-1]|uniref:Ion-translocating oxidoreductase complex subunit A n=1 Tax=Magnetococcus marinus (strain ATCC BAA-1437 / JCM 17883 / MC-1) TaxID=156889 RepID=A0L5G8_MAGMM|nr:electron transport complex subunit RsxA [Magnetococcus marinus]ABK43211.1 electron transport complex, RnfABCDGE type, A subunit [Magnetococcus marinus MC-1]
MTEVSFSNFLLILISTVFVNNYVLAKFLGICPFLGVSKKVETAVGMTQAVMFVMTLASVISWLVQHYILDPLNLGYLQTISFILIIASLVQLTEMVVHKTSPVLYASLGIFLPLITTNCAVLGVALLNIQQENNLINASFYGVGAGLGFGLVLILFAGMRERVDLSDVPRLFKGSPISLINAGLMSLAFMGFAGLVK